MFWLVVAIAVTAGFWWERQRLVKALASKPQFFVMDANNTYYLPVAMDFEQAKDVHAAQSDLLWKPCSTGDPAARTIPSG